MAPTITGARAAIVDFVDEDPARIGHGAELGDDRGLELVSLIYPQLGVRRHWDLLAWLEHIELGPNRAVFRRIGTKRSDSGVVVARWHGCQRRGGV
ncbi:hypothetical protein ACFLRH_03810 [Actinomycetota bacterium]